ncbi:MAG: pseudouridine synthase [Candidatus Aenigmatarchaeota archaeon]
MTEETTKTIRIQKYLSDKGIVSRRKAEKWIAAGYVYLNGEKVTVPGTRFDPRKDNITIDPKATESQNLVYFLFNKPRGIVTVNAQKGETEIKDIVKIPKDVVTVGRLDKDSSGLILLTNDGVVARRVMESQFNHEKEYEVRFTKEIPDSALNMICRRQCMFGEKLKPVKISRLSKFSIRIILQEGKNRQVRRLCEGAGFPVKKLKRVRILDLVLGDMKPGELRQLSEKEVEHLRKILKIEK